MKMKKLIICLVSVITIFLLLFPNLSLNKQFNRCAYGRLTFVEKSKIIEETEGLEVMQAIDYSVQYTAKKYKFSRKVNCTHYAQLCAEVYNVIASNYNLEGHAYPVCGSVEYFKLNLCDLVYKVTKDPFFKNHDFTEIKLEDDNIYVDACIYDLLNTKCITYNHER